MHRTDYTREITIAAHLQGLDPELIEAIVVTESSGCADAFRYEPAFWSRYLKDNPAYRDAVRRRVSSSYGLMQVMYPAAVDHGFNGQPEYLFLPNVNLDFGCRIVSALLRWAGGDQRKALAAYNGGQGNVDDRQAQAYADRVFRVLNDGRSG